MGLTTKGERMRKTRTRFALVPILILGIVVMVAPTQANAEINSYFSCQSKPSGQWCDGRANGSFDGLHSWDYVKGWYPGTWDSSVTVCQHVWRPATGQVLAGATCDYNWTEHYYGNVTCACYEAEVLQYSSGPRNLNGNAEAE